MRRQLRRHAKDPGPQPGSKPRGAPVSEAQARSAEKRALDAAAEVEDLEAQLASALDGEADRSEIDRLRAALGRAQAAARAALIDAVNARIAALPTAPAKPPPPGDDTPWSAAVSDAIAADEPDQPA
jgi:hypothetical protein